jgi:hypothetical protein
MEQESKQEGQVEEQPKEEISKEPPKPVQPEEKKTSERTYTEAEWRKMQSMKDKAESDRMRYEKELTELRKKDQEQRLAARKREIESFEGEPEEQAKARRKHELEDELDRLNELKLQQEGAVQRKYDQALELASQHDLSLADARELMAAETPKEMELMAQIKIAERKKVPEPEIPTIKPDSGMSDVGHDSDEEFQKRWNSGDMPATKENVARIQKILKK